MKILNYYSFSVLLVLALVFSGCTEDCEENFTGTLILINTHPEAKSGMDIYNVNHDPVAKEIEIDPASTHRITLPAGRYYMRTFHYNVRCVGGTCTQERSSNFTQRQAEIYPCQEVEITIN